MFEFRMRILDVRERDTDPPSFLGIVEGFPEVLVHTTSPEEVERDLTNALSEHLRRLQDREATRIDWDDYPTVRMVTLYVLLHLVRPGVGPGMSKNQLGKR